MNTLIGLGVALAASLLGNWWLYDQVGDARQAQGVAEQERNTAIEGANMCSRGVTKLQEDMKARSDAAKPAVDAAKAGEQTAGKKAQVIIQSPPSRPNDDCGSARDRIKQWIKEPK